MGITFVVEDGTGLLTANSYAAVADADAYHTDRGNDAWTAGVTSNKETALVRATMYLDKKYSGRWVGYPALRRLQGLQWPRVGAYIYTPVYSVAIGHYGTGHYGPVYGNFGYDYLPINQIPKEVIQATCEAALRELVAPGSLMPDVTYGSIKRQSAGDTSQEWNAAKYPVFRTIGLILSPLLLAGGANGMFALAQRG